MRSSLDSGDSGVQTTEASAHAMTNPRAAPQRSGQTSQVSAHAVTNPPADGQRPPEPDSPSDAAADGSKDASQGGAAADESKDAGWSVVSADCNGDDSGWEVAGVDQIVGEVLNLVDSILDSAANDAPDHNAEVEEEEDTVAAVTAADGDRKHEAPDESAAAALQHAPGGVRSPTSAAAPAPEIPPSMGESSGAAHLEIAHAAKTVENHGDAEVGATSTAPAGVDEDFEHRFESRLGLCVVMGPPPSCSNIADAELGLDADEDDSKLRESAASPPGCLEGALSAAGVVEPRSDGSSAAVSMLLSVSGVDAAASDAVSSDDVGAAEARAACHVAREALPAPAVEPAQANCPDQLLLALVPGRCTGSGVAADHAVADVLLAQHHTPPLEGWGGRTEHAGAQHIGGDALGGESERKPNLASGDEGAGGAGAGDAGGENQDEFVNSALRSSGSPGLPAPGDVHVREEPSKPVGAAARAEPEASDAPGPAAACAAYESAVAMWQAGGRSEIVTLQVLTSDDASAASRERVASAGPAIELVKIGVTSPWDQVIAHVSSVCSVCERAWGAFVRLCVRRRVSERETVCVPAWVLTPRRRSGTRRSIVGGITSSRAR